MVSPGEEASSTYHPVILVFNKHGVFQGSRFGSAVEEGGLYLLDIVFNPVMVASLGERQGILANLPR